MKYIWILVLSTLAFRAHAADILSEPTRCLSTPKQFDIEDEDMRFKSIKVLQGKKIVLESRIPGENLELDCSKKSQPQNKDGKYSFIRQERKASPTASAMMAVFTMGLSELPGSNDPGLQITNKSEFPVHTTVDVPALNYQFSVTDSQTGKSFRVECLFPIPSGVRVYAKNKDQKEKVMFYVGSATANSMDLVPKEVDKTKGACVAKRYSLNLAKASLSAGLPMAGSSGGGEGTSLGNAQ